MHLAGKRRLYAPADAVWTFLLDADHVCHCIPGCRGMERLDEEHYRGTLDVPIPLLRGEYVALIAVTEQQPPNACRLALTADTAFGFVRAGGSLTLEAQATTTVLSFDGDLQLGRFTSGGALGLGGRLLQTPARMLLDRFFACLDEQLASSLRT